MVILPADLAIPGLTSEPGPDRPAGPGFVNVEFDSATHQLGFTDWVLDENTTELAQQQIRSVAAEGDLKRPTTCAVPIGDAGYLVTGELFVSPGTPQPLMGAKLAFRVGQVSCTLFFHMDQANVPVPDSVIAIVGATQAEKMRDVLA